MRIGNKHFDSRSYRSLRKGHKRLKKNQSRDKLVAICERVAAETGYEFCDVSLDQEAAGLYVRIYIDLEQGISLDDCERYHKTVQPLLEFFDYDFLEVCSPGIDRPIRTGRDIEKSIGRMVEVKLYKSMYGSKSHLGTLIAMDGDRVEIQNANQENIVFQAKDVAQVRLSPDLSGLDETDDTGIDSIIEID